MTNAVEPSPGSVLLGKYRVERVLGKGGMGLVIEATHLELLDRVAIKVMRHDVTDEETRSRFVREARAAARLKCEHVARVVDVGTLPSGSPYMVMELLDGVDLGAMLRERGTLAPALAIDLILQACVGLAEAHALALVHRDVKPSNLFVSHGSDGSPQVKLLDFGISKTIDEVTLTSSAALLGSPAYMSPEQWRRAHDADARSDIWSIGVVLYELVHGIRPFSGDSYAELCTGVLSDPPLRPATDFGELGPVIDRCLEKDPANRYQMIVDLARDLARLADTAEARRTVERMERMFARQSDPDVRAKRATATPAGTRPPANLASQLAATAPSAPTIDSEPALRTDRGLRAGTSMPTILRAEIPSGRAKTVAIASAVIGLAVAVVVVVVLAANRSPDAPDTRPPTASGPRRGDTLRFALTRGDEPGIALYASTPTRSQYAIRMIMERLLSIDGSGAIDDSVVIVKAQDDATKLVLEIRAGVQFHGSECAPARPATADDLKYSIEVAQQQRQLDLPIKRITTSGNQVVLQMAKPAPFFTHALAEVWLVPTHLAKCEPDLEKMRHPIGTGPFKLGRSLVADKLVLDRFEHYWRIGADGQPLPYLEHVELVRAMELTATLDAMRKDVFARDAIHVFIPTMADRAQLVIERPRPHLDPTLGKGLELGMRTNQGQLGLWELQVTTKQGPLRDVRIRRAIAYAIDRRSAVAKADGTPTSPMAAEGRFLRPGLLGFDRALSGYDFDSARASALLAEAGHPQGKGLSEIVLGYRLNETAVESVMADLAKLGIPARGEHIENHQSRAHLDAMFLSHFEELRGDELVTLGQFDPHRLATGITPLLEDVVSQPTVEGRQPLYAAIERALLDHVPTIPLARLDAGRIAYAAITRSGVKGFHDPRTNFVPREYELRFVATWLQRE